VQINRGQDKGVRVGDRFSVVRPDRTQRTCHGFKWQVKPPESMGALCGRGQVRCKRSAKVSVAQVIFSCGYMQRGESAAYSGPSRHHRSRIRRPSNHFAPLPASQWRMVVAGKDTDRSSVNLSAVYVNPGSGQGSVKVGDSSESSVTRVRWQRPCRKTKVSILDVRLGSRPVRYEWNNCRGKCSAKNRH